MLRQKLQRRCPTTFNRCSVPQGVRFRVQRSSWRVITISSLLHYLSPMKRKFVGIAVIIMVWWQCVYKDLTFGLFFAHCSKGGMY